MSRRSPFVVRLSPEERAVLEERAGSRSVAHAVVVRARIILLAADDMQNVDISAQVGSRSAGGRTSPTSTAAAPTAPPSNSAGSATAAQPTSGASPSTAPATTTTKTPTSQPAPPPAPPKTPSTAPAPSTSASIHRRTNARDH